MNSSPQTEFFLDYKKLLATGNDKIFEGVSNLYKTYLDHLHNQGSSDPDVSNHHKQMSKIILSSLISSGYMREISKPDDNYLING